MIFGHFISFLVCIAAFSFVSASLNNNLHPRSPPSVASNIDLRAVQRASSSVEVVKRDTVFKNSTTLDTSWNGATLFGIDLRSSKGNTGINAGLNIVCTTCYIKGTAIAQLNVSDNFNISQAFQTFKLDVEHDVTSITNTTVNDFETYFEDLGLDIADLNINKFENDLTFPTLNNTSFDLEIPDIPGATLLFQFDGLELYMEIDTILSGGATYTVNIYRSETPIGVGKGQDNLGITFSIDLILSAQAQIDISSGFHIKLNDGVAIELALFSQNVSSITTNGGHFEFLPVTIESAGVQLTALLKLGLQAGLNVASPPFQILDVDVASFSSGAGVGIWMNVAEFITNVTAAPAGDTNGCEILVEEAYSMAIGAQAGATLALDDLGDHHTWGPSPHTSTVLFYTTLASHCALTSTSTSTSAALTARAARVTGLTTTTLTGSDTYTATQCLSTGLLNCPISLQTTSKQTVTSTLVTSVPSGSTATFPTTIQNAVASTITFGSLAQALTSASGTPTSFIPTASPTGIRGVIDGKTDGVSNKLIIGLSVGLGVPILIGIITGIFCLFRRRRSTQRGTVSYQQTLPRPEPYTPSQMSMKKMPSVVISESLR